MVMLEYVKIMSGSGPFEPQDPPAPCAADGPVSPTGTVLEAVECDTARYVAIAPVAHDVHRTYLILSRANVDGTALSYGDINDIPELQNALAHFGPQAQSVRVLTHPGRRRPLSRHIDDLDEGGTRTFEFSGEEFSVTVNVG